MIAAWQGNINSGPLGMGSRHVGLSIDGKYKSIGYGIAFVNGFQGNALSSFENNALGIFGNVYYTGELNRIDPQLGLNAGCKPKGNRPIPKCF